MISKEEFVAIDREIHRATKAGDKPNLSGDDYGAWSEYYQANEQAIVAEQTAGRDKGRAERQKAKERPDYDSIIEQATNDGFINAMEMSKRWELRNWSYALGMFDRLPQFTLVFLEPDGERADNPPKYVRCGLWPDEFQKMTQARNELLQNEKAARDKDEADYNQTSEAYGLMAQRIQDEQETRREQKHLAVIRLIREKEVAVDDIYALARQEVLKIEGANNKYINDESQRVFGPDSRAVSGKFNRTVKDARNEHIERLKQIKEEMQPLVDKKFDLEAQIYRIKYALQKHGTQLTDAEISQRHVEQSEQLSEVKKELEIYSKRMEESENDFHGVEYLARRTYESEMSVVRKEKAQWVNKAAKELAGNGEAVMDKAKVDAAEVFAQYQEKTNQFSDAWDKESIEIEQKAKGQLDHYRIAFEQVKDNLLPKEEIADMTVIEIDVIRWRHRKFRSRAIEFHSDNTRVSNVILKTLDGELDEIQVFCSTALNKHTKFIVNGIEYIGEHKRFASKGNAYTAMISDEQAQNILLLKHS